MLTQNLLQKIVKYALEYNGHCLFVWKVHFWRHIIDKFVYFNSKWMYIVMVYRRRIIFMYMPPEKRGWLQGGHALLTFSEIVLCQGGFLRNSLLRYSRRGPDVGVLQNLTVYRYILSLNKFHVVYWFCSVRHGYEISK